METSEWDWADIVKMEILLNERQELPPYLFKLQ